MLNTVVAVVGLALCLVVSADESPAPMYQIPHPKDVFFYETFESGWENRWKVSSKGKFAGGDWSVGQQDDVLYLPSEQSLILKKAAQHHAISTKFARPIAGVKGKDFVLQYEVRFTQAHQCGGAYIKLLAHDTSFTPEDFDDSTPYIVMFGPDKCGATEKVHFIFRHQSPTTKKWEEKHLTQAIKPKLDTRSHLYTLVVRSDNSFEIFIDQKSAQKGSLLEDFTPPVNPPKEIDDPTDHKPSNWVDEAKIRDPSASKPDDWDEDAPRSIPDETAVKPDDWCDDCPLVIPDPEAEMPDDWDEEMDGAWQAPEIANPKCEEVGCGQWVRPTRINPAYRGKWEAPLIDNPAYKGEWKARQIPNPDYFEDENPHRLSPIGGAGFELWTMQDKIEFDNIFIDTSEDAAFEFGSQTWAKKADLEKIQGGGEDDDESIFNQLGEWVLENTKLFIGVVTAIVVPLLGTCYMCSREASAPVNVPRSTSNRTTTTRAPEPPSQAPAAESTQTATSSSSSSSSSSSQTSTTSSDEKGAKSSAKPATQRKKTSQKAS